ncbi:hypothetical protein BCON_0334g00010 [Botryotinia convoluta]|uniref:Uncharacterized protein n=1 Tax=Botryotinia convoluta TaxID=54673 RepID=A0A4Z1HHN6_9HELO|nr:hypothetical protein BCON_0334g00010 [Botryotinia convoluta]
MASIVNSHPSPIACSKGCAITDPTQLKIVRTNVLTATPLELRLGGNSFQTQTRNSQSRGRSNKLLPLQSIQTIKDQQDK